MVDPAEERGAGSYDAGVFGPRHASLESLRESEWRFRTTFDLAPVGMAHVAPTGEWLSVNERLCELLGYTSDELRSMRLQQLTHPEDLAADLDHVIRLLAGEASTYRSRKRFLRKDGSSLDTRVSVTLVRDPARDPGTLGVPFYFVAVVEPTLAGAEESVPLVRLPPPASESLRVEVASLLEQMHDAFFTVDPAWTVTYVNQAAERILRRRADELLGHNLWSVFPDAIGSVFHVEYQRAIATGHPREFEAHYEPFDTWVLARAFPSPQGLAIFVQDVTERKRAERDREKADGMLRRLLLDSPIGIIGGEGFRISEANEAFLELLGIPRASLDAGEVHWPALTPARWADADARAFGELLERGATHPYEKEYIAADGRIVPVLLCGVLLDREARRWTAFVVDLTERERLARERASALDSLQRRQAELETLNSQLETQAVELEEQAEELEATTEELLEQSRARELALSERVRVERRYRALVEATTQVVWRTEPDGQVTEDIPAWRAFTGLTAEAARGYGWASAVHPGDRERVLRLWRDAVARRGLFEATYRLRRHDGAWREVVARGVPVLDDVAGALREWVGTTTDVTDRLQAERDRELLAAAVARLNDVVVITAAEPIDAPDGPRIEFVSDSFVRLTGYSREEAIGSTPRLLQGPNTDRAALDRVREALRAWRPIRETVLNYRKDGSTFWNEMDIVPVADATGWYTHWIAVQRDVTQRIEGDAALRDSERRLSLALEAIADGLLDWTPADDSMYASPRCTELLGYAPGEIAATRAAWVALVHPEDRGRLEYVTEAHLDGRLPGIDVEVRLRAADGRWRWLHLRGRAVERDGDGRVTRVAGTMADIAMRKASEGERLRLQRDAERARQELSLTNERLRTQGETVALQAEELQQQAEERDAAFAAERQARAEAERANRAKSDFLAAMSHELRTPLNAIGGYVDLLELEVFGPATERQREALGRIRRSGTHLLGLINDVLNFAKVEAGSVDVRVEDVPLARELVLLEELTAPQVAARGLRYTASDVGGLLVRADRERLRQILLNLLGNAIKFTEPQGRIDVGVEVVRAEGGLPHAAIAVRDTGRGIPADRLESIFEPFVQVDRHLTQESQQGVGLGLSISRDLARRMGGDLTVTSMPGAGSTFVLTLPVSALPGGQPARPAIST